MKNIPSFSWNSYAVSRQRNASGSRLMLDELRHLRQELGMLFSVTLAAVLLPELCSQTEFYRSRSISSVKGFHVSDRV
ncbi:hypothetical protein TOPH_08147 [Tolypocladium ophioglossoides CBS 100239]|uniref:Uncharacterized protein n=1 Tax=Tolypocladium ophioglossoides (strain CBS 100239) TaxID=1163406 RepID=A0A0L0MZ61_TOLOC|nr:hypothetical protein TOPH_08147 [Tolypocladium ophioglossoides CBS 100239]